MTVSWLTTEDDELRERERHPRIRSRYIDGQGEYPLYPATSPSGWPIAEDLSLLAHCQASCPWRGGIRCRRREPRGTAWWTNAWHARVNWTNAKRHEVLWGKLYLLLVGCPRRCEGCSKAWPHDSEGRHVGPIHWPHSNRVDCARVRWLGMQGVTPANTIMWTSQNDPLTQQGV